MKKTFRYKSMVICYKGVHIVKDGNTVRQHGSGKRPFSMDKRWVNFWAAKIDIDKVL